MMASPRLPVFDQPSRLVFSPHLKLRHESFRRAEGKEKSRCYCCLKRERETKGDRK